MNVGEEETGWNALHYLSCSYFEPDFSDIAVPLCSNGIDVKDLTFRNQVLGHMIAFYEEIRSDDDPTADSEDLH